MNSDSAHDSSQLRGNLLRLSERRTIAIYERKGVAWVADFTDSAARLSPVTEWFCLNRRVFARACRDGAEPLTPLPSAVVARIERLHRVRPVPTLLPPLLRHARQIVSRLWRSASGAHRRAALLSPGRPGGVSSPENVE